ncbi:MAG: response regulator [Verrucomicrobiales bacterium]|nr:response regulator [Verrucomicrobiales bacterium]
MNTQPSASGHTARILLVDDDDALRRVLERVLRSLGFHVECAANGGSGWKAIREGNFDLLITDYNMPEINGIQLLRQLRASGSTLPVILVTAEIDNATLQEADSLGKCVTLPKPFEAAALVATIWSVLDAR